jgi:hypothetical protein
MGLRLRTKLEKYPHLCPSCHIGERQRPMASTPTAKRRTTRLWLRVKRWAGSISAFIIGVSAVSAALVVVATNFPKIFPVFAPFDASILLRDARVVGVASSGSGDQNATADITLEYVLEKTGPSTLHNCQPELRLQDVYSGQSGRSETITEERQEKLSESFRVKREQYGKEAGLRMVCERRITTWAIFNLPEVTTFIKPTLTSYYLCMGEHREACGGTPNWVPCSSNPSNWAKSAHPAECVKVDVKKISDVGGNQCGYATFEIVCSSK